MIIGFLCGDTVLSINIHDTYYVIAYFHLTILISLLFGVIGLGYWIMQKGNRRLSKWLSWTHVGLTFGGAFAVLILSQLYRGDIMEYEFNNNLNLTITLLLFIIILGQIIFPINIIHGLLKRGKQNQ